MPRRAQVRTIRERLRLQVFEFHRHRHVVERTRHVVIRRHRFVSQRLPQRRQRLHFRQLRLRHVRLELQQLNPNFQEIHFADVARFVTAFADVHRVLKAFQVLRGEIDRGFGHLHVDVLRGHKENQAALVIDHGEPRLLGHVARRLQTMLPLAPALEQIAEPHVKLRRRIDVVRAELVRLEDRQKLRVALQHRIRPQVRRNFFGLVLLHHGALRQQIVIVLERHLNGVIERDLHRTARGRRSLCKRHARYAQHCNERQEPKVSCTHMR